MRNCIPNRDRCFHVAFFTVLSTLMLSSAGLQAQDDSPSVAGRWEGTGAEGGGDPTYAITAEFHETEDGILEGYFIFESSLGGTGKENFSGEANGRAFTVTGTSFENISGAGSAYVLSTYHGTLSRDGRSLTGTWHQGGTFSLQLVFKIDETPHTPRPDLTGVEIIKSDTPDTIDEIAIGQSFRVRLTFTEDPGTEISETVTIRTSDGTEKVQVTGTVKQAQVTGDAWVIVSDPILVVPSGQ